MIEALHSWIFGLAAAAVCIALLQEMIPKGTIRSVAQVSGGLVLLMTALQPISALHVDALAADYSIYQQQLDQQIAAYQSGYEDELARIIEQEIGAYISEKAGEMGLSCQVSVATRMTDGVPIPISVRLGMPHSPELSLWISREIGIAPKDQYWEGST